MFGCRNKDIEEVETKEVLNLNINRNLKFEYAKEVDIHDFINDEDIEIISKNTKINTFILGKNKIKINYKKNNRNLYDEIIYEVVDTTKPLVLINSSYTVEKGSKIDLVNKVLCADNYDKRPNCYIEGDYNINKIGTYNLKHIAIDTSGNKTENNFKLKVVNPSKNNQTNNKPKYNIKDFIKDHKNEKTSIGIDVSSWQGDIDYNKVKNAGVEFVMIRLGYGHNKSNELVLDKKFINNIKNAKKEGLLVGIYFYSYANTIEKVKEQVNYIIEKLNGEQLDLPIAFDWEDWKNFNKYNMSLTDINIIAKTFKEEVLKHGYNSMLYSSKYYLEQIWDEKNHDVWLAHYTNKTTYKGNYSIWQISNRGRVPGINADVDFDILYK